MLRDHDDDEITKWLAFARAIQPDFRFRPNPGISRQKVDAIATLCEQEDSNVLKWLKRARLDGMCS